MSDSKQLINVDDPNVVQYVLAILDIYEEIKNGKAEAEKEKTDNV